MKLHKWFVLVLFSALSAPGFALDHQSDRVNPTLSDSALNVYPVPVYNPKAESDGYDVMMDMVLRPVGLVGTVIGAGLFVGVSPLTALATIPPPHDAFQKLADTIICKPAKYTFNRSPGNYRYSEGCMPKYSAPVAQPVVYNETPKPAAEPAYKQPDDTNKKIDAIFKQQMMK